MKLLVVIAVGLRPADLKDAPRLATLAEEGFQAPLETVFPAVTCTVQASLLTGTLPREHGIVGNGWYHRDTAEVRFWLQSNHLIERETLYAAEARESSEFRCAKLFWWFNMHSGASLSVTPRPEYHADGRKVPGLYSEPPELNRALADRLGPFPLFQFWGPGAGLPSSRWIAESARIILDDHDPDLTLVYLPHLDYDHQRHGPDDPRSRSAVGELDACVAPLIDRAREEGREVIVLGEYGIEAVDTPVFLNRFLRERGELCVQKTGHGELLDAGRSGAFAVCDHQAAHIYVKEGGRVDAIARALRGVPGVERVLDRDGKREMGIDHPRSGDLVCIAEPGTWFAYPYWLDEAARPDFATTVDIHRKPGYDPAELFLDPALRWPKLRIARRVLAKKLGFRSLIDVIPTDPAMVRGSHGRLPDSPERGPVILGSFRREEAGPLPVTEVGALIRGRLARGR